MVLAGIVYLVYGAQPLIKNRDGSQANGVNAFSRTVLGAQVSLVSPYSYALANSLDWFGRSRHVSNSIQRSFFAGQARTASGHADCRMACFRWVIVSDSVRGWLRC